MDITAEFFKFFRLYFGWLHCLFVAKVGSNFCLMNQIRICRVPWGSDETNGLCSCSPKATTSLFYSEIFWPLCGRADGTPWNCPIFMEFWLNAWSSPANKFFLSQKKSASEMDSPRNNNNLKKKKIFAFLKRLFFWNLELKISVLYFYIKIVDFYSFFILSS